MRVFHFIILSVILFIIAIGVFFLLANNKAYNPPTKNIVEENRYYSVIPDSFEMELISWNIGYGGLGKGMDYFYDGGKRSRTKEENANKNMENIVRVLEKYDETDVFLLQEVDKQAKRSFNVNQLDYLANALPEFNFAFGKNYDVFFVPVPIFRPVGRVVSGILNMSRIKPVRSVRYAYPGQYEWPKRLFMLNRCFLVHYYATTSDKELLVINTHNSAFDDGSLRSGEMQYLKRFVINAFMEGNYVIVGGDWNQLPPGFVPGFNGYKFDTTAIPGVDDAFFLDDWTWAFDATIPTNRSLDEPFNRETTGTRVLDYFLLSPNIELLEVENIDLGFEYADHQPVKTRIRLK